MGCSVGWGLFHSELSTFLEAPIHGSCVSPFSLEAPSLGGQSLLRHTRPHQPCPQSFTLFSTGHGTGLPPQLRPLSSEDTPVYGCPLKVLEPRTSLCAVCGVGRAPASHCPWSEAREALVSHRKSHLDYWFAVEEKAVFLPRNSHD